MKAAPFKEPQPYVQLNLGHSQEEEGSSDMSVSFSGPNVTPDHDEDDTSVPFGGGNLEGDNQSDSDKPSIPFQTEDYSKKVRPFMCSNGAPMQDESISMRDVSAVSNQSRTSRGGSGRRMHDGSTSSHNGSRYPPPMKIATIQNHQTTPATKMPFSSRFVQYKLSLQNCDATGIPLNPHAFNSFRQYEYGVEEFKDVSPTCGVPTDPISPTKRG